MAAMERLPDEQREVVALILIEGFGYREAAEMLDLPIGTVSSRLVRGRTGVVAMLGGLLMIEEEKFFAWLDGELPPEEAARVEPRLRPIPLSRLAAEHRAMTGGLRDAFAEVEGQPVPERSPAAGKRRRDDTVVRLADADPCASSPGAPDLDAWPRRWPRRSLSAFSLEI